MDLRDGLHNSMERMRREKELFEKFETRDSHAKIQTFTTRPPRYSGEPERYNDISITDLHIRLLSDPNFQARPADPTIQDGNLDNGPTQQNLYALLPANILTMSAGMHPLTQPGIQVPYYNVHYYATHDALHQLYNNPGPQIAIICQIKTERELQPADPGEWFVGTATLPRNDVAREYAMVLDQSRQSVYILNTTGLNSMQYATVARLVKEGAKQEVMQQCVEALRDPSITLTKPHIHNLLNKVQDMFIQSMSQPHFRSLDGLEQPVNKQQGELRNLVQAANGHVPNQDAALQAAEVFWAQFAPSASDKTQARYSEFRETVMKSAEKNSASDALAAGCKVLASQSTYLERIAINNVLNSADVKGALAGETYTTRDDNFGQDEHEEPDEL